MSHRHIIGQCDSAALDGWEKRGAIEVHTLGSETQKMLIHVWKWPVDVLNVPKFTFLTPEMNK